MKIKFLTFLTLLALLSCSSSKSVDDDLDTQDDSVGLEDENSYESDENINEEKYSQDTIEEQDEGESSPEKLVEQQAPSTPESPSPVQISGEEMLYTVEGGDTLMLISFKLYGDYSQWKSIQQLNPELSSSASLKAGTKIKVVQPNEEFVWKPEGSPYLIKRNDTLRKISVSLYETERNWDHLYKHNSRLIKNPDIIYAGFTIYYLDAEQLNRDPANTAAVAPSPQKEVVPEVTEQATAEVPEETAQKDEPYAESSPVQEIEPSQDSEEMAKTETMSEGSSDEALDNDMAVDDEAESEEFEE